MILTFSSLSWSLYTTDLFEALTLANFCFAPVDMERMKSVIMSAWTRTWRRNDRSLICEDVMSVTTGSYASGFRVLPRVQTGPCW